MLRMEQLMVFTRLWNRKALSLQRQGRMGTLASVRGQEAGNVAMGRSLAPEDWFCPAFREMPPMLRSWGQFQLNSSDFGAGMNGEDAFRMVATCCRVCITVGSHLRMRRALPGEQRFAAIALQCAQQLRRRLHIRG